MRFGGHIESSRGCAGRGDLQTKPNACCQQPCMHALHACPQAEPPCSSLLEAAQRSAALGRGNSDAHTRSKRRACCTNSSAVKVSAMAARLASSGSRSRNSSHSNLHPPAAQQASLALCQPPELWVIHWVACMDHATAWHIAAGAPKHHNITPLRNDLHPGTHKPCWQCYSQPSMHGKAVSSLDKHPS